MSNVPTFRGAAIFLALTACLLCPQAELRAGTVTFNDLSDDVTVLHTTGSVTSRDCVARHRSHRSSSDPKAGRDNALLGCRGDAKL